MQSDGIPEWAKGLPELTDEPTGKLVFGRITPPGQEWPVLSVTTVEWHGGDLVAISLELLEAADPTVMSREGNTISIGPFRLEAIGYDPRGWVLARRLR